MTTAAQPLTPLIRIHAGTRAAEQDIRIAEAETRRAENEIALKVQEAYLGTLLLEKRIAAARQKVEAAEAARADAANLTRTRAAVADAIARARAEGRREVIVVTGIPGAGKTLCGLNAVFGAAKRDGAAFLSGNAPLIAVLREALARDAVSRGATKPQAEREVKAAIQNVHRFLEDHALDPARVPPERLIVFDEAQRAWDERKARQGTQNRPGRLTMSEPAQTLEIMGRHDGWAVVVALIGGGQEINTGEAGIAEWGRVIAADPRWGAAAGPGVLDAADPLRRLAQGRPPWLRLDPALDLTVPLRAVRDASVAEWVEAVLAGDAPRAAAIAAAAAEFPVFLTRDLDAMRAALRGFARGLRRAGIVRSSGAKRLRGEGLAAEVAPDEVPDAAAWLEIGDSRRPPERQVVFRGWMFANAPGVNMLEHPVYDVRVLECLDR